MRTLFWCCCAIVMTVASLVYVAADYAREYPNSMVGRCVLLAYRVGCDYNPVSMLGRAVSPGNCPTQQPPAGPMAGKPVPSDDGSEETELTPDDLTPCEIIDLTQTGIGGIQECEEKETHEGTAVPEILPAPAACDPRRAGDSPVMVPPGPIQESEDELQTIPAATDDPVEMPATMPRATEDTDEPKVEGETLHDLWMGLFKGAVSASSEEPPIDRDATGGSEEESEAIHDGVAPDCKEDPSYHHQYPGCPYMGGCPSSDHCSDPASTPEPAPKKKHKKKAKPVAPMTGEPTAVPEGTEAEVDEECPAHPDVDTTEYRKSDATHGEFSRHPF